jgi:hypothetical protein
MPAASPTTANATANANAAAKPRRRWRRRLLLALLLLSAYPLAVLGTVYTVTLRSDLPGGRHGPKDALRHTLASALVAYTSSPDVVHWVTDLMEGNANTASRAMDRHNNRIGASIGSAAQSFGELFAAVRAAVAAGAAVPIDPFVGQDDRIAWLPKRLWRERLY